MEWYEIFGVLFVWSIIGICFYSLSLDPKVSSRLDDWDIINPFYIYKNFKVNWFGAFLLFLLFNLLCPFYTIGYWFYKLCTVGRKSEL